MSSLVLLTYSCKEKSKSSFKVSVAYSNADKIASDLPSGKPIEMKAYLEEIPYGKDVAPIILDSNKLSNNAGSVVLTGSGKPHTIFDVSIGTGENVVQVPFINDASDIKITIDLGKRNDFYQIEGSPASKQLQQLVDNVGKKNFLIEKSFAELDSLKRLSAPDSVMLKATEEKNDAIVDLNNYLKNFINNTSDPTLGVLALSWGRSLSRIDFENALNGLLAKYPDNVVLQGMKKSYLQQSQAEQQLAENSWVGKQAPELRLPDVSGKNIDLSSFKGKYVLVDFWASWCEPCRMENPNVVKAYQEYKDKNFAILGVSLDSKKDAW
ncbi:MAG TPA: TlpA disulfide reductase family protein, partial [Puia sp.]|nr:TlpA disulfide reductase family protein [Puia sp.]